MPSMKVYRLFADEVGNLLGDASLEEPLLSPFHSKIDHNAVWQNENASDEVNAGVLCEIFGNDGEPFISLLSPPPTHIILHTEIVHHESLQHYLCTSVSSLHVLRNSNVAPDLYAWLIRFLSTQPPVSPLRTLILDFRIDLELLMQFMNALAAPSCRVLHLELRCSGEICFNYILKCLPKIRCLSLSVRVTGVYRESNVEKTHLPPSLIHLELAIRSDYAYISHLCEMLQKETCKLRRLDLRGMEQPLGAQEMGALMQCVASPSCFIQDLGISLQYDSDSCSILAQVFAEQYSLSLYSKLKILRFKHVHTDEAARCVVKILASPHCKVRFLDIQLFQSSFAFFSELRQVKAHIECVRAHIVSATPIANEERIHEWDNGLADFVGWEDCPLLWLQCESPPLDLGEQFELHLANALQQNYHLLFLHLKWRSDAACSRAAAFLERNRLYKAAGLNSKQELAKPKVARLFLCGHGEVGKTTIRKALINLNNRPSPSSSMVSQAATCINKALLCCTSRAQPEPRTHGLEIHELLFHEEHEKMVIFDLAGQSDYHVFHHYFMNNTSNDLFMVVCKYVVGSTDDAELVSQMQYWLRFIVSHRNMVHGPNPKVMLVLNFFPPITPHIDMFSTADDITRQLRITFADVLDFGTPGTIQDFFGINALSTNEIKPILTRLGILLTSLLKDRPMIPKLSLDLVTSILPQLINSHGKKRTCGILSSPLQESILTTTRKKSAAKKVNIIAFEQVKELYFQQQRDSMLEEQQSMLETRIQVALIELHNIGDVVFFPPTRSKALSKFSHGGSDHKTASNSDILPSDPRKSTEVMLPIITDSGWFCNKVVGNLLAPEAFKGMFKLKEERVRQIIRENGCPNEFLDEMMRYMQDAELCFVAEDYDAHNLKQNHFFFPAVSTKRELEWPSVFKEKSNCDMHFYGRRLKCKYTEKHLIPSGVFARLQVNLLGFCSQGDDRSYRMGYRWVSFMKDSIGVMVRFGGGSRISTDVDHALIEREGDSVMNKRQMMHQDDHPEWIDILVCGSKVDSHLRTDGESAMSTEDSIMDRIKHLIFEICQATSRGIPTVVLEEWVLRDRGFDNVISLAEIEEKIRTVGLHSAVAWQSQDSTPVVKLLLPKDLQNRIMYQVQAVREIQAEFAVSSVHNIDENEVPLTGEIKQLYDALRAEFRKVTKLLEEIKTDVHKLRDDLRQMEINIVANCSTQLLEQMLAFKSKLPAYPYLSEIDGKLRKLQAFVSLKKARVYFLCESANGLHKVEGQKGKEVAVDEGVLIKAVPILVPALRVMCCAAKFAVNMYLPGVAPPGIFDIFLNCVKPLGISSKDLQYSQIIMPRAMNALLDGIDFGPQKLEIDRQKEAMLKMDKGAFQAALEALQNILGHKEDLDMVEDFGLHLIQINGKACWVCKDHAMGHQELSHPKNPFST